MYRQLKRFWQGIRQLSGDDAYERYLQHYAEYHQQDGQPPLNKAAFLNNGKTVYGTAFDAVAKKLDLTQKLVKSNQQAFY